MRYSILLLLFSSLHGALAAGAPPFAFHTRTDLQAGGTVAVVAADFNQDGIPDVAALGLTNIQVFLGQGHRQFAAPMHVPLGGLPSSYDTLAVADLNGDGIPDLVASSGKTSPIFFGNGDGTFRAGPVLDNWGLPIKSGDFNLDGKTDLALAQGNQIEVLLGNGDGTFGQPVVLPGAGGCVAVGDFNGDGKPDVLGCAAGVTVFPGHGDGTFGPGINSSTPSAPVFAVVGDLDRDGKQDVAAVAVYGNGIDPKLGPVYLLYGNGDGTFRPTVQLHTGIGEVISVGIGDLNGDGLPDLVAAGIGGSLIPSDFIGGLVGTYFNQGAGKAFARGDVYPVTFFDQLPWNTMLVADLDGDHIPDVVQSDNGELYFSILFNNGKGRLQDIQLTSLQGVSPSGQVYGSPLAVMQGNFDGKGSGELAFVIGNSQLDIFVPTGNRSQPFAPGPTATLQPPSGDNLYAMVAGDFNGDGNTDVAISYSNTLLTSSLVQVYLGNGSGAYRLASQFSIPMTGIQMIAGDFNGDGKLDIATSSGFLALGNGDGTFQNPTAFYKISALVNTFGTWLGAADFNHDGKLDIAFQEPQNPGAGQPLLIFLGNGDGTFQTPARYQWGSLPAWGAMADLNGDGNIDIVLLSGQHPQDHIGVLLGNADGTFQPPTYVQLPFTVMPVSIVATDLNGDGKADLAVMDSLGNSIHLFAGNGDGTFGPDTEFGGALNMAWMGFGNYQGQPDGFADLVFVTSGSNSFTTKTTVIASAVSTLLNDGWRK